MHIEVSHASKAIKGVQVLEDVCLKLDSGKVYGIEGPNGSGKTMLMRAILGLIRLDSGNVMVDGAYIGRDLDFAPDAGALIESASFLLGKTGRDNLLYLTRIKNVVGEKEVDAVLAKVGLRGAGSRRFRQYSLGMRQRLGIAAAIVEKPRLVVLDEPTNALDESGVEMVQEIVAEQKASGALVLVSCHDAELLGSMADARIRMSEGRVSDVEG